MALMLSACGDEPATLEDAPREGNFMVSFSLRLENTDAASLGDSYPPSARSADYDYNPAQTWGNFSPADPGNEFDNRLMKHNFHLLILDNSNTVVGKMVHDNMDMMLYTSSEEYTIVGFQGILNTKLSSVELDSDDKYKVFVFANGAPCSTELGSTFRPDDMTFKHIGQPSSEFYAIPMWGVSRAKLAGIKPGKTQNIGFIDLLRAMAKIRVDVDTDETGALTEAMSGFRITSLKISNCNTMGHMLPKEWGTLDYTQDLSIGNTLSEYSSLLTNFGDGLQIVTTETGATYVELYVPEYNNTPENEFLLQVGYTIDGAEQTEDIHICKYSEGVPDTNDDNSYTLWPIVRNHYYHYTIISIENGESRFRFKASIQDLEDGGTYIYEYD